MVHRGVRGEIFTVVCLGMVLYGIHSGDVAGKVERLSFNSGDVEG
jgi:hypothetical protein